MISSFSSEEFSPTCTQACEIGVRRRPSPSMLTSAPFCLKSLTMSTLPNLQARWIGPPLLLRMLTVD